MASVSKSNKKNQFINLLSFNNFKLNQLINKFYSTKKGNKELNYIASSTTFSTKKGNEEELKLSHIDPTTGMAHMVDISNKPITQRTATAKATVYLSHQAFDQIHDPSQPKNNNSINKKGDVLGIARIAGIQASKLTSQLIPLCHQLPLSQTIIEFQLTKTPKNGEIKITAICKCNSNTGVEMEALTACTITALTIFDMCKAVDKKAFITDIKVSHKDGGKSGEFLN